ncbi:MAG: prepilin-type N-terminal cleavage/methylation domain-containing protein [Candidatus Zixiibacteriota bacterium]|nr:MAG: prepilin-type N-terminal cleavage/methylation domain-containing protein [candidate division Zixibacteria bacterium]
MRIMTARNERGFTLIELMIVVCIISILAMLAIPRFMQASTKTKQSEAKTILKQIYVNQRTFRQQSMDNTYFVTAEVASKDNPDAFRDIWIQVMATCRYSFEIAATPNTFVATARGNIDDDPLEDVWTITDAGILDNPTNDVEES